MLRADKELVVAELAERLRSAETLIVADYRGLTHAEMDDVRSELLKHGARFSVCKNTLTKRAAETAGVEPLLELLIGPTAIAFVHDGDMVAVAKTLQDTARTTRRLELKGAILGGRPVSADGVRELASLPPADVLRGQVLGAIVAPLTSLVGLVNAPLQNLVGLIDARIGQLEEDAPAAEAEPPTATEEDTPEASAPAAAEAADAPDETTTSQAAEEQQPADEAPVEEPPAEESEGEQE
jgi:large subunit ribosomal protein L10